MNNTERTECQHCIEDCEETPAEYIAHLTSSPEGYSAGRAVPVCGAHLDIAHLAGVLASRTVIA